MGIRVTKKDDKVYIIQAIEAKTKIYLEEF